MDPITVAANNALCPGCFAAKGGVHRCPHCGYDEQAERGRLFLPHRTLLHDQYLVGRVLGKRGGSGITYLGWDLSLQTRVAIKEYLPMEVAVRSADGASVEPLYGEEDDCFRWGLDRFLGEARTLARIDHRNVVRVRYYFRANGTAYLVMDYYQGLSLAEYLVRQGGHLPEAEARRLLLPILDGLRAVHAKDFLHRDIKPQNIYLADTDNGERRPILLDFGAARQAIGGRTRTLTLIYTDGYAPVEQYDEKGKQGPWTDVYSAAAVLYHLVTGKTPPVAITRRRENDSLKPAAESKFGVSKPLSDALAAGLAIDSEDRPQSIDAFRARLVGTASTGEAPPAADATPAGDRLKPAAECGGCGPLDDTVMDALVIAPEDDRPKTIEASQTVLMGVVPPERLNRRRWWWPAVLSPILVALVGWYLYPADQPKTLLLQGADDRAFAAARMADTESAYRDYLNACVADGCVHRAEAERGLAAVAARAAETTRMAELHKAADERAFAAARAADTEPAYGNYLSACVADGCGHRTDAERRRSELAAPAVERSGTSAPKVPVSTAAEPSPPAKIPVIPPKPANRSDQQRLPKTAQAKATKPKNPKPVNRAAQKPSTITAHPRADRGSSWSIHPNGAKTD